MVRQPKRHDSFAVILLLWGLLFEAKLAIFFIGV